MEGGSTLEIALDGAGLVRARWERGSQAGVDVVGKLNLDRDELSMLWEPSAYGRHLGEALFQGKVGQLWEKVLAEPGIPNISLNVIDAPLTRCNWGWLQAPMAGRWQFLGLAQRVHYSMYPLSEQDRVFPKMARTQPRVLLLAATPPKDNDMGLEPFDDHAVVEEVGAALSGQVRLDVLASQNVTLRQGPASLEALGVALARTDYPILHLVAHGQLLDDGTHALYFQKEDGSPDAIEATRFVDVLAHCRYPPRLVILSSCHSADPNGRTGERDGNLAWCLASEVGIHCVVAMTEPVSLQSAGDLAKPFYEGLFRHGTVEQALAESRASLCRRSDVMVPVVYSRLRGQPLFQPTSEGTVALELDRMEMPALKIKQQRHLIFGLAGALALALLIFPYLLWQRYQKQLHQQACHMIQTAMDANDAMNWQAGFEDAGKALRGARRTGDDSLAKRALVQQRRAAYHLPVNKIWFKHPEILNFHAWTPQGILTISPNLIRHWQVGEPEPVLTMKLQQGKLTAITLARDGGQLVTAGDQGNLWLWSLAQGEVTRALNGLSNAQRELHFSPDNSWVYATDRQGYHFRWDLASGALHNLQTAPQWFTQPTTTGASNAQVVPFNESGKLLVTIESNGIVQVKGNFGGKPLMTIPAHIEVANLLGLESSTLTFLAKDGTVRRWSSDLLANTWPILDDANKRVLAVSGRQILMASAKGVSLWDGDQKISSPHEDRVGLGIFSQSGKRAVTIDRLGKSYLWKERVPELLAELSSPAIATGFTGEEPWIATERQILFPTTNEYMELDPKAGKPYVVTVGMYVVVNQHVYSRESQLLFSIDRRPQLALVSDQGQRLAVATQETIGIWDLSGNQKTGLTHNASITSMAFDETGTHLAVGMEDSRAYVYNLREETPIAVIDIINGPITHVSFNGDELITVDNHNLRRWQWRFDP